MPTAAFPAPAPEPPARLAGPGAQFREHQLEAVRDLVEDRARVLCVQRTGWGKSAVYFIATALLRERGAGPALIVSPLLALMRDQIAAAQRLGMRAHTINSTNREKWDAVRALLAADAVDLLLISPERLNNPDFRDELLPLLVERVGLVVVDEAHCISDWGHDFRPDYRRIEELLDRLPPGVAVLGTTATANDRVVANVTEQLGAEGAGQDLPRAARAPHSPGRRPAGRDPSTRPAGSAAGRRWAGAGRFPPPTSTCARAAGSRRGRRRATRARRSRRAAGPRRTRARTGPGRPVPAPRAVARRPRRCIRACAAARRSAGAQRRGWGLRSTMRPLGRDAQP